MTDEMAMRALQGAVDHQRQRLFRLHQEGECAPPCRWCRECPGHERGGKAPPCCDRAGEYNGYGSDGPLAFHCPRGCSCHD